MDIISLAAEQLTGWDFLVAGIVVCITEWGFKPIMKKVPDKIYDMIIRLIPVVLGLIAYMLLFLIQKTGAGYTSALHGIVVGLTSMGSYEVILEAVKKSGSKGISDVNEAVKDAVEKDRK